MLKVKISLAVEMFIAFCKPCEFENLDNAKPIYSAFKFISLTNSVT